MDITLIDTEVVDVAGAVYLAEVVRAVMDKMAGPAERAGVSLQATVAESTPSLIGDTKRIQKALLNLVTNAIKFTERGGWAKVAVGANEQGLIIEVRDNGVGMPPGAR